MSLSRDDVTFSMLRDIARKVRSSGASDPCGPLEQQDRTFFSRSPNASSKSSFLSYAFPSSRSAIPSTTSERKDDFEDAFGDLEKKVLSCCSKGPQGLLAPELRTFLALSRSIENVTSSLDNDI